MVGDKFEYPVNPSVETTEELASWGRFKLTVYLSYQSPKSYEAQKIIIE